MRSCEELKNTDLRILHNISLNKRMHIAPNYHSVRRCKRLVIHIYTQGPQHLQRELHHPKDTIPRETESRECTNVPFHRTRVRVVKYVPDTLQLARTWYWGMHAM